MSSENPYIKPAVYVGAAWAGWKFVLAPILETLNLKDTKQEADQKKLIERVEKLVTEKDYWDPNYFQKPPAGTTALLLTYKDVNILAKQIEDAAGTFNDNEDAIYSAFKALRYKSQVSYLAFWFSKLFAKDLYTWLKDKVLNQEEMAKVLQITEKLPYGFKNIATGSISGIGDKHTYFHKIIQAVQNGRDKWARSLYASMSKKQQTEFWNWIEAYAFYDAQDTGETDYLDQIHSILKPGIGDRTKIIRKSGDWMLHNDAGLRIMDTVSYRHSSAIEDPEIISFLKKATAKDFRRAAQIMLHYDPSQGHNIYWLVSTMRTGLWNLDNYTMQKDYGIGRTGDIEVLKAEKYPAIKHNAVYYSVRLKSGNTVYLFSQVKGEFNYVSILKETANPFGTSGKQYDSWDHAMQHYKNQTVRTMILMAENIIKNL